MADDVFRANYRLITPHYFSLLGIPISSGRSFASTDRRSAPHVAIVSGALARAVWGSMNPVGSRIRVPFGESDYEIIGVAGDVRTTGLDGEASPMVYVPAAQGRFNFMTVVVKTRTEPQVLMPSIRRLVRELDPNLPLYRVRTLDELAAQSVAQQRFQTLLVGSFSILVFVLAVIGTYGVTAYGVSERTSELGIRMALGATGGHISWLVLREGARLAVTGIVIGGVAAALLSRALSRFVFQIGTLDPVTFIVTPALLAAAALLAAFLPAQRAARADPLRVLRTE